MSDFPFIGRTKNLQKLRERILTKKQHIAINGLPQIGKTRILEELKSTLINVQENPCVILSVIHGYSFPETMRDIYEVLSEEELYVNNSIGLSGQLADEPDLIENNSEDSTMESLRKLLLKMSQHRKVIVMLDEFERIFDGKNSWTEQQYNGFVRKLVLNEALDGKVFWIVASRARLDNLLLKKNYEQRLNPFVSVTIRSFGESDMRKYFCCLNNIIGRSLTEEEQLLLWKHCGRYPKLLILIALNLKKQHLKGDVSVAEALQASKTEFESHFDDIIDVIAREEKTTMHSLSNLVRCYFNPNQDDKELKLRLRSLGYMEEYRLNNTLPMDNYPYSDMTVSPTFVYYLFKNYLKRARTCQGTQVDGINDPRVLLPGLILLLRRITRKELSAIYPGEDWNERLLIEKCVWNKWGEPYREFEISSADTLTLKEDELPSAGDRIILTTPVNFIADAYRRKQIEHSPSDTWLLDCISLRDQAAILLKFPNEFSKYFRDVFKADLNNAQTKRKCKKIFNQLTKARNEYAHYHCGGLSAPARLDNETANNCKQLLCSIYTYIVDSVEEYDLWL